MDINRFRLIKIRHLFLQLTFALLISMIVGDIIVAILRVDHSHIRLVIIKIIYCLLIFRVIFRILYDLEIKLFEFISHNPIDRKELPYFLGVLPAITFSYFYFPSFVYFTSFISPQVSMSILGLDQSTTVLYSHELTLQMILINLVLFLLGVVVVPIYEEFIFRGVILNVLRAKMTTTSAIVISSIMFGMLHGYRFLDAIIASLLLSIIYLKLKSLYAVIIVHAIYNGLAFFYEFKWIINEKTPLALTMDSIETFLPTSLTMSSISLILFIIYLFFCWPRANTRMRSIQST